MPGAAARVSVIVASLCCWQGLALAQSSPPGGPAPGAWLTRGLLAGDAAPAVAQEADRWLAAPPSYDDYFSALGYSVTHGLVARENLLPLAIGSAAALAVRPFDRQVSNRLRGEAAGLGRTAEMAGGPRALAALSGGLMLGSLATDDARFRSYAFTFSQGLVVTGAITTAVKFAVRRPRPDHSSRFSFPSGHAAGSFALAAITSHYYGAKAGVPLYTFATLVAVSRVAYGKHFPSDVVAGAAIGYIAGRAAILGTEHVTGATDGTTQAAPPGGAISFSLRF